jgi:uncharacterized protein YwqG
MNPIEQIRSSALAHHAETLERLLKPAIRIWHAPSETPAPIGVSKLGGDPDLPPDFIWSEWNGTPMAFLAQFRLDELAPHDIENLLPPTGMLYFFYEAQEQPWGGDIEDEGGWRVFHYTGQVSDLVRTPPPKNIPEYSRFREIPVRFEQRYMLPFDGGELETLAPELGELIEEEWEAYTELANRLAKVEEDTPKHWLLGYHASIQDTASAEVVQTLLGLLWDDALAQIDEWVLLLHLDTDDATEMMWGDAGTLYFWIHQDDLAARRFDKVWMILQCY